MLQGVPIDLKRHMITYVDPSTLEQLSIVNSHFRDICGQTITSYFNAIKKSPNHNTIRAIIRFLHFIDDEERHNMFDMESITTMNKYEIALEWFGDNGFTIDIINQTTGRSIVNRKNFSGSRTGIIRLIEYVYTFHQKHCESFSRESSIIITRNDIDLLLSAKIIPFL
jgi:hypothetical protein